MSGAAGGAASPAVEGGEAPGAEAAREPVAIRLAEAGLLPEAAIRWGIRRLVGHRLRTLRREWSEDSLERIVEDLGRQPIAPDPEAANRQHYVRPPDFFRRVLGPRVKYSAAYWPDGVESLGGAERAMLDLTCRRAAVRDGARILDLGCGWGALTLWVAERYADVRVTALSNSPEQVRFVRERCRRRGVGDRVRVVRSDVAEFRPDERYDRVLSVEMFEHLRNYRRLLDRVRAWLAPGGRLFVHVFSHRRYAYPFTGDGAGAWMGRHFFTGGLMPAHGLLPRFDRSLRVERAWRLSGLHYARTAEAWKQNLDAEAEGLAEILRDAGEPSAELQVRRWRIFFLAVAEMFGYREGREWGVSHYRLRPRAGRGTKPREEGARS